jgi:hypothetical protein
MGGFDQTNFKSLRDTILVTEPEAVALYTLRMLQEEEGDGFMAVSPSIRLRIVNTLTS